MSETKHTPGPWVIGPDAVDEKRRQEHLIGLPRQPDGMSMSERVANYAANATLISAAPEMLEAHEDGPDLDWYADRLVNVYGESEGADFIIALRRKAAKARAAIKKARGEK